MIVAIGISDKDERLARQWLAWVALLSTRAPECKVPLLVMQTCRLNQHHTAMFREALAQALFPVEYATVPDEEETGYPKSASHLFLRTMEHCEKAYPGQAILWCEPDTVPMIPGWQANIESEYKAYAQPFMGVIERGHGFAHLAGVAVYPHNWRKKAPLLANVMNAPDVFWGKGLGQAFDTYAAPETVPQTHEARTIQQVWRPIMPITQDWIKKNVRPGVALFHQCKDGSMINVMKEWMKL
jgi:hypothetical protein